MESKKIAEVHQVLTTRHQLIYGEKTLIEEREETTITEHDSGTLLRQVVTTKKQIGDQVLVLTEEGGEQSEMTSLEGEELDAFKAKWANYWKPCITKETIKTAIDKEKSE